MKDLLFIIVVTFLFVIGNPNASNAQSTFKLVETAKKGYTKVDLSKHTGTVNISGFDVKGGISKSGSTWILRKSKSGKYRKQYLGTKVGTILLEDFGDFDNIQCDVFVNKAGTKYRAAVYNTNRASNFQFVTVDKQ